jgi:hypothetical protein
MWYLLYQRSINEEIHSLKQKLWKNNKKEYSLIYGEKDSILEDLDNYIPNDDTIYNSVENSEVYKKIRQETNRYRLNLMEIWDSNRKSYTKELSNIMKASFEHEYSMLVIHPTLDVLEVANDNIIVVGKKVTVKQKDDFLTYLFYKVVKEKFQKLRYEDRDIINVILELITLNELFTRMTNVSKYNYGKKDMYDLKKQIYPYWLMYLGVNEDNFDNYMIRDNIFFNKKDYEYNKTLKDLDIYDFISFCIKNKKKIFNIKPVTVEEIEII